MNSMQKYPPPLCKNTPLFFAIWPDLGRFLQKYTFVYRHLEEKKRCVHNPLPNFAESSGVQKCSFSKILESGTSKLSVLHIFNHTRAPKIHQSFHFFQKHNRSWFFLVLSSHWWLFSPDNSALNKNENHDLPSSQASQSIISPKLMNILRQILFGKDQKTVFHEKTLSCNLRS